MLTRLILTLALLLSPAPVLAQVTLTPVDTFNVRLNGNDTTYMRTLTHRYVNGALRLLTMTHTGRLVEFAIPSPGQEISASTASWELSPTGALDNHYGIWFEQAKNRLWVTAGPDYTNVYEAAKVTLIQLGANGTTTVLKQFRLSVPGKRVYGGCQAVPASLVTELGGAYVCGWGGYTSLVAQGGGASMGPTMYAIPDPDTIAAGSTVTVRTVLDHAATRGVRKTLPLNYFDGGDPRQNPSSRPSAPPITTASWLSPNSQGQGWMVWGDSYYNTGMWIGDTFASVASLCGVTGQTQTVVGTTTIPGAGACWYQSSTLAFDGRTFELHTWAGAGLGSNVIKAPDAMVELNLARGNGVIWGGNSPAGNVAGATYDPMTQQVYMVGYPFGPDVFAGRFYRFSVSGSTTPPPDPQPIDAVLSEWSDWTATSAWSACVDGSQSQTQERTRTVVQPAQNGGTTGALSETRTVTQACTVTPPPDPDPDPEPDPTTVTHEDLKAIGEAILAALAAEVPDIVGCLVTSTTSDTVTIRRSSCGIVRPVNGSILRVVRE